MMFSGLRFVRNDQRGFTLIELLIAIVIAGLITGGITFAIMQILTVNTRASNHMIAVRQVQQAGKEVSKDALQAQNVTCGVNQGFPIALNWTEWGTNYTHGVIYSLEGTDELKKLQRQHYANSSLDLTTVVAEYISSASFVQLPGGVAYNFTVTATVGDQSETREYEVKPRPGS
jgi:prepilin-type N-terminal cleavage/methylation domain-containing protein